MNKTRTIISANLSKHGNFEEYFKIIEVIEDNEFVNPDICIESCKALVEGISKTILINLDNTKTPDNIDKDELPKLFKEAVRVLSDECEDMEAEFVARFSSIIQVLGELRNKRGDISHGRMAPKVIFSSTKLATTVKNMTESMLEYLLEHYFSVEISPNGKLNYLSEEMDAYNTYLDESLDFPIKKAKYSQLLYENDYDEYESRYSDEFLKATELEEELVEEQQEVTKKIDSPKVIVEVSNPMLDELINDFNEELYWTQKRTTELNLFAGKENIKIRELKKLINGHLFTKKRPLRDDVANAMVTKPILKERAEHTENLIEKIIILSDRLNKIED